MEQEEIIVDVKDIDAQLHNLDEVKEQVQFVDEDEETENDYRLARDRSKRVFKPHQRLGYANLIAYALISTSEVLDEELRDYKEVVRIGNRTE